MRDPGTGPRRLRCAAAALLALVPLAAIVPSQAARKAKSTLLTSPDDTGTLGTVAISGAPDPSHPFFQSLGTNGRTCATCHDATAAWTITPALAQARFAATGGADPLFRPNDGSNSPVADVSTVAARQSAYSMLLTKGVIRIGIGLPPNAEFALDAVDDPYGYASASELSLFRRPLPATNLRFESTIMWDGRESPAGRSLADNLASQARDATLGHAQGGALADSVVAQIVDFEAGLFTAQQTSQSAGPLTAGGAHGGPKVLATHPPAFTPLAVARPGQPPAPVPVFDLFPHWLKSKGKPGSRPAARGSVARGEALFNTRTFNIRDVRGFNDVLGQESVTGTCASCHNIHAVGNSTFGPMDIGVGEVILRRTPDEPLYTLRNLATNETISLADPGQALVTGKWADLGKFKVPALRGLAARPPYFHNGSGTAMSDVLDFYNRRFGLDLSPPEMDDLAAFLLSL